MGAESEEKFREVRASNKAGELFLKGYNCAQSVFGALAGDFGIDEASALKLSAPLGGGVGRMREVCGAFSACAMLLGLKRASAEASDERKREIYALTQKLAEDFKKRNGSIICREILGLQNGAELSPKPESRDAGYYASRPCLRVVEQAFEIIREYVK